MKTLINPLKLTTSSLILGFIVFNINPAEAAIWSRPITASQDNFSSTINPTVNNGTSPYLSIGQWNGGTGTSGTPTLPPNGITSNSTGSQISYLSFDLQSILNEVAAISPTAVIRNVSATVVLQQTNNNTSNPNYNPAFPGNRRNSTIPRISLNAFQVTGNFSESTAINPSNPPATNTTPLLFSGAIRQGTNTFSNSTSLNNALATLLNNKNSTFSMALRPSSPASAASSGIYPIENILSNNNTTSKPTVNLSFEVWDEASKITGEPNFKVQGRAGAAGAASYEAAILTSSSLGDKLQAQQEWVWGNAQANNFELSCNPTTKLVTFTLFSNSNNSANKILTYTANSCKDVDGLKIFSSAQLKAGSVDPNAAMEIIVDQAKQIGSTTFQTVTGLSAKAFAGPQFVEDAFFFTDTLAQGGLGFTQGTETIKGRMIMSWPGPNNPQAKGGQSNLQVQLIPLARVNDPKLPPNSVPSNFVPSLFSLDDDGLLPASSQPLNNEPQSVPEPTSVISLILLGTLGLGVRLKSR